MYIYGDNNKHNSQNEHFPKELITSHQKQGDINKNQFSFLAFADSSKEKPMR